MVATVFDLFAIRSDATDYKSAFRELIGILNSAVHTASGTINIGNNPNSLTVDDATDFAAGQMISVAGAGEGGDDLVTWISAISGNTLTLADAASGSVASVTVVGLNTDTPTTVISKIESPGAEVNLTDSQSAIPRLLIDKLRENVSAKDFGATGDGTTDDRASILAASDNGQEIFFPPGDYKVASDLTIAVKCVMADGAKFVIPTGVELTFDIGVDAGPRQHIFEITGTGKALLPHRYSLMWFGALADNATDTGPFLQQAIDSAANVDIDGHATDAGQIYVPRGLYRFETEVTYIGSSGYGLTLYGESETGTYRGGDVGSQFNWYGTNRTFLRWEGANGSTIKDLKINSYAGTDCYEVVWIDAINGDPGSVGDSGSSGVRLLNTYISIQNDCRSDTACLAIGHPLPQGGSTSQVSEVSCYTLYCVGPNTGNGIGIDIREGGNTKVFSFRRALTTNLDIGIKWIGSSYMYLTDSTGGQNNIDIKQTGGGSLHINCYNSEASDQFLVQVAGTGGCQATIRSAEWAGYGGLSVIAVRGWVELNDVVLRASGGDDIPWISFDNLPDYSQSNHAGLMLKGVSFSQVYYDGDNIPRLPVRDGSQNVITDPTSIYATKRCALWAYSCVNLNNYQTDPIKLDYDRPFIRATDLTINQRDDVDAVNGDLIYNSTTKKLEAYVDDEWSAMNGDTQPLKILEKKVADLADYYPGKYVGNLIYVNDEADGPCLAIANTRKWARLSDNATLVAGDPYDVLIASALVYFPCQEPSGNLIDSIDGATATPQGSPIYDLAGPTAWLPKAIGTSSGNWFSAGNVTLANVRDWHLSVAAWVYPTTYNATSEECVVGKRTNVSANGYNFRIILENEGYVKAYWGADSQYYNGQSLSYVTQNQWQLIVWTRDSVNGETWGSIDGVEGAHFDENQQGAPGTTQDFNSSDSLNIGFDGTNFPFTGRIAGLAIFNKVLTANDIAILLAGPGA